MQDSILIVEDEKDIAELISVHMNDLNLNVTLCDNGDNAIKLALDNNYSLLVLDINLPGCSGLDVCRKVRENKPEQAILMLTSRTSEVDRIVGLELGADDYMTKPFSIRELQARVHALLRRVHLLENRTMERWIKPKELDQFAGTDTYGQYLIGMGDGLIHQWDMLPFWNFPHNIAT